MDKTTIVYGIANCDTVKKARAWLDQNGIAYRFHDFRKDGVPAVQAARWMAQSGWEALVNRKGTTWRRLDGEAQARVLDAASAAVLMQQHPSVIKRPVVDWGTQVTVGFDGPLWERIARDRV